MSNTDHATNMNARPIDMKSMSALIGVSIPTLNRMKKEGKLPHHRIGGRVLFFPDDIAALLDASAKGER